MDPIDRSVGAIFDSPRAEAERTLSHLAATHKAKAAALLVCHCDRLEPIATHGDPDALIDTATALWMAKGRSLERGEAIASGGARLVPLRADGTLVGILALGGSLPLDSLTLSAAQRPLLRALRTWQAVALSYVGSTSPDAFLKEKLLYHLAKCQGKIAPVAKIMNVTRNTIYSWLEKYQISRPRSPRRPARGRLQE